MSKLPGKMTRKQHWVPQFYLRHFASPDGQLQAYRCDGDRFFATSSEKVCVKQDLYEVAHSDNADPSSDRLYAQNLVERKLSEIEGRLAPLYSKLIECCKAKSFTPEEYRDGKLAACYLAAQLIMRHPHVLGEERRKAPKWALEFRESSNFTNDELAMLDWSGWQNDYPALVELAMEAVLLFSGDPRSPLNRTFKAFAEKQMSIIEAPLSVQFITSSFPLLVEGATDDEYEFDVAYMPLDSRHAALFADEGVLPLFGTASPEGVKKLNSRLLLSNDAWDVALAKARGSLKLAVQDWKCLKIDGKGGIDCLTISKPASF